MKIMDASRGGMDAPTVVVRDAQRRRLRFGSFEFAPETLELRHEGAPVRVQAQALRMLALLLSRPQRLVSRDEIIAHVWGSTVVDYDQGINNAIRQLRAALGDDARRPNTIETVPRLGYRFIAPIQILSGGAAEPAPQHRPSTRRLRAGLIATVALVGLATVLLPHLVPGKGPPRLTIGDGATDDYLRARYLLDRGTPEATEEARGLLEKILDREPDFAPALIALAETHLAPPTSPSSWAAARQAADQALGIDPRDAHAHLVRSRIALVHDWDWELARRHIDAALNLAPDDPQAHLALATWLSTVGRHDEAIMEIDAALRIEPVSAARRGDIAFLYFLARRPREALLSAELLLELKPDDPGAKSLRIESLLDLGRYREAREAIVELFPAGETSAAERALLRDLHRATGPAVEEAYLTVQEERWKKRKDSAVRDLALATIEARRGLTEEALHWLKRAIEARSAYAPFVGVDPHFASLRSNAGFRRLVASIPKARQGRSS